MPATAPGTRPSCPGSAPLFPALLHWTFFPLVLVILLILGKKLLMCFYLQ